MLKIASSEILSYYSLVKLQAGAFKRQAVIDRLTKMVQEWQEATAVDGKKLS